MAAQEFSLEPGLLDLRSSVQLEAPLDDGQVAAIRDAIEALPALQRDAINAFFYERVDVAGGVSELARRHDTTRWFVYKALEEGEAALRQALADLFASTL